MNAPPHPTPCRGPCAVPTERSGRKGAGGPAPQTPRLSRRARPALGLFSSTLFSSVCRQLWLPYRHQQQRAAVITQSASLHMRHEVRAVDHRQRAAAGARSATWCSSPLPGGRSSPSSAPPRGRTPSLAEQRLAEQRHRDCGTATARRSALAYAYCTRGAPLLCIVLHSASMRLSCRHVAVTDCLSRVPYLLK